MTIHYLPAARREHRMRVAAYCRVSTLMESQEESLETQRAYYGEYIARCEQWDNAGIYADEGLSGLHADKRPAFLQMMEDAMAGCIDLILVKSISRFSRNAMECQRVVRQLKSHGVYVYFEKERINSGDPYSELVFNIRAAYAQEESRIIGENVRWSCRKNFEQGIHHLGNNRILGYDEVEGVLTPNAQASTVQKIFRMYAEGASLAQISRTLDAVGAKRLRSGKPFNASVLRSILTNEAYVGDLRTMKNPPRQLLNRPRERDACGKSLYWKDHHPAIIERAVWEAVQRRMQRSREAC